MSLGRTKKTRGKFGGYFTTTVNNLIVIGRVKWSGRVVHWKSRAWRRTTIHQAKRKSNGENKPSIFNTPMESGRQLLFFEHDTPS